MDSLFWETLSRVPRRGYCDVDIYVLIKACFRAETQTSHVHHFHASMDFIHVVGVYVCIGAPCKDIKNPTTI